MRWSGPFPDPSGWVAGREGFFRGFVDRIVLCGRSRGRRGAAPPGASPRPISRHGCRTGGAPDHPRSRARMRRSSGRPLRGHGRRAGVRARARRRSSALSTAQLDLLGRDGIAIFAHAIVPCGAETGARRTDGLAGRSHEARSKGNLPDKAPLRPGPSRRCSRRRARRCLVLTVAAGMPSVSATSPTSSSSIWRKHEDRAERRRELVDRVVDHSA